jgi:hypothetical protein
LPAEFLVTPLSAQDKNRQVFFGEQHLHQDGWPVGRGAVINLTALQAAGRWTKEPASVDNTECN